MPVYEYACEKCGRVTEALRRMAEADEPIACESCGATGARRVQSVTAAAGSGGGELSLPMGGCCPCGKPQSACGRG